MKLDESIKKYRIKKNITQGQLAGLVGVSAQAVSKWECGDTIPDATLLIPIADALEISLSRLCGHEKIYESDTYYAIAELIRNTPEEKRMEKVREICWQTEKGLFSGVSLSAYEYEPDELKKIGGSSAVVIEEGFTFISNRTELPFYSIFPEPEKGFAHTLKYDEKYRQLFEAFADEYVLQAFFHLYAKPEGYTFEQEVLAKACNIPDEKMDSVMEKLCRFCFSSYREYDINGEKRMLYTVSQKYELVAIFAMVNEFLWHSNSFRLHAHKRDKPYLEKREYNL